MKFKTLIIGSDINAYYMARCYHEEYNDKAHLIAKEPMNFTNLSTILTIEYHHNLWEKEAFLEAVNDYAEKYKDYKILIIPSNDFYVRLIVENKKNLRKNLVFHDLDIDLLNNLLIKDNFYNFFKDSELEFPKTYIYDCSLKNKLTKENIKDFKFPIIIKPGDGVAYYKAKFEGQSKVYKVNSLKEIQDIISKITNAGYKKKLIIQEFIPGGDDKLFDSIFYCNKNHKAELASFAQIGLQEHTHTGIGNCTVLVNGFCEFGNYENEIYKMKEFLENNNYCGFAEFDLKYDERDKKFKVFEINPRQARSSYYLCACGYNLVKYLVDDLIKNEQKDFVIIKKEYALSFVPTFVIKKYIKNDKLKKEVLKLKKRKNFVDPLNYKQDKNLKRKAWLFIRKINYIKKYKNNQW